MCHFFLSYLLFTEEAKTEHSPKNYSFFHDIYLPIPTNPLVVLPI